MTIKAIYENGVFRPTEAVVLPEFSEVDVLLPGSTVVEDVRVEEDRKQILDILSYRFASGQTDTAERHNEHQS